MEDFWEKVIHFFHTLFWGSTTLAQLAETLFRTVFMYLYALFLVRLIGKRGVATLAPFEMAVIVLLGSILADPMMNSPTPLIKAMLVLTVIIGLERLLVHLTEFNTTMEDLLESSPRRLVGDGIIHLASLHQEGFSREDLFLNLREKGIEHLGQIKCAFLETSGRVSVWTREEQDIRPGLSLIPILEDAQVKHFQSAQFVEEETYYSCQRCGKTHYFTTLDYFPPCPCGHDLWEISSQVRVPLTSLRKTA